MPKYYPSTPEVIWKALTQRRCNDTPSLFEEVSTPCFWRLSDLATLYPHIFSVRVPLSQSTVAQIYKTATNYVPEFKTMFPQPIHILNIKDSYNIRNNEDKIIPIKNGPNQKLTRIACEFMFRQFENTEIEQAYFMYPDKPAYEIAAAAEEIKLERARNQISETTNVLSGIVNRAYDTNQRAFRNIWASFWQNLYNSPNMEDLRTTYKITSSPIDYMSPKTLTYINSVLQEIVIKFQPLQRFSINHIADVAIAKAKSARKCFLQHGSTPEAQLLLNTNSKSKIARVRNARQRFWRDYYPQSLIQR